MPDRTGASRRRMIVGLVAVALVLVSGTAMAQAPGAEDTAMSFADSAGALAKDGDFDGAIRLYQKAYDLAREPVLLYNVGRMYDKLGDLAKAREVYERYLAEEKEPEGLARGRERLEAVLDRIPGRLQVTTEPVGAAVEIDGRPVGSGPTGPLELGRGVHAVWVKLEGHAAAARSVEMQAGESSFLHVRLEPVPVPLPVAAPAVVEGGPADAPVRPGSPVGTVAASGTVSRSPWPWVSIGIGAASLVTGGVMTGLAYRERSQVTGAGQTEGYVTGITQAEALAHRETAGTYDKASYALYAVGGAAVVTGVVLWFVLPPKAQQSLARAPAFLTLAPVSGGGVVGATGRF